MASWGKGLNFTVRLDPGSQVYIHFPASDYATAEDALTEACRQFRARGYEPLEYYLAEETNYESFSIEEAAEAMNEQTSRDIEREELEEYQEHPDDWKGTCFLVWNDRRKT